MKNGPGETLMRKKAEKNAWAEHYERLLNVEFQ